MTRHDEDDNLTAALAQDVDGNFERLVRVYQDRLFAFALRMTGNAPDAEEGAQDAFVRAHRALTGYSAERRAALRLRPWLYQITLNVVRNRVRRRAVATVPVDGTTEEWLVGSSIDEPESVAERAEERARLARMVAELPAHLREAVVLRHIQGLSYAEVAEVLGQPVGTAKSNAHRGLQVLRKALEADERSAALVAGGRVDR